MPLVEFSLQKLVVRICVLFLFLRKNLCPFECCYHTSTLCDASNL